MKKITDKLKTGLNDTMDYIVIILIFFNIFLTKWDSPIKGLSVKIMFMNSLFLIYTFFRMKTKGEDPANSFRCFFDKYKLIILSFFIMIFVEILNFSSIKGFLYFVQLIIHSLTLLIIFEGIIDNENYRNIILKLSMFFLFLNFIFIIHSLYIHLNSDGVVFIDGNNYEVLPYHYSISLRQRVSDGNRLSSFFSNPNHLGFYANLSTFFLALRVNFNVKNNEFIAIGKQEKWHLMTSIILLYLTKSRASLLMFLSFIIIYICLNIWTSQTIKKMLFEHRNKIFLVGSLFLLILISLGYNIITKRNSGSSGRIIPWSISYNVFQKNKLIGKGSWEFLNYIKGKGYPHSHNSYLQIIASGGIGFLLAFLLYIYTILKESVLGICRNKSISIVVFSFIVSLLLYNFFETTVLVLHPANTTLLLAVRLESLER